MPPINIMKRRIYPHTSTPQKFFSEANVSSIHAVENDESIMNPPEPEQFDLIKINTTKADKPRLSDQPAYVATRYPSKEMLGKQLEYTSIEQAQAGKIHDVVDVAAAISMVSAMDLSIIVVEENEYNDGEENISNDSFKLTVHNGSSIITNLNNQTEDNHGITGKSNKIDSKELTRTNVSNHVEATDSFGLFDNSVERQPMTDAVEVHRKHASPEVISVSSTSTSTTISTTSPSFSTANQPKLSVKPTVGFDASNSIHVLSAVSQLNESSQKLVMKSGKWRRTIFEARRNKVTECKFALI